MQRRSAALYGILGLVLLAFAAVDYFISSGFRPVRFDQPGRWHVPDRPVDQLPAGPNLHLSSTGVLTRYGANAVNLFDRLRRVAGRGQLYFVNTSHAARPYERKGLQPFQPIGERGQRTAEAAEVVWLLPGRRESGRARTLRDLRVRLAQVDLRTGRSR